MASTRTVEVIIQAVSPLSGVGATAAATSCAQAGSAANRESPVAPITPQNFLEKVIIPPFLQRGFAGLAGADAHGLTDIKDEDLTIADCAGIGRGLDRFDYARCEIVIADDLDLDFRNHVRGIFGAPVDFGLPLLAAEALHLGHRHAGDA